MKLIALRTLDGLAVAGQPFEVSERAARRLLEKGVAQIAPDPKNKMAREPRNKAAEAPLAGSPTGAAGQPSSSGPDQAPAAPRSAYALAGPASSSSTNPGGSGPALRSSTPATGRGGRKTPAPRTSRD